MYASFSNKTPFDKFCMANELANENKNQIIFLEDSVPEVLCL